MPTSPAKEISAFASERSVGEEVDYAGETLEVEAPDFRGVELAFIATPLSVAKGLIDAARKAGSRVIDFSGALRSDAAVPLIAPGVSAVTADTPVVTVAGAAALGTCLALAPIHRAHPVSWLDVVGLYGAAFLGRAGVRTLEKQSADLLGGRDQETPEPFPHRLGFNIVPQVGAFAKGPHPQSSEELALALDVARIFEADKAPVLRATALQVPTFHGVTLCLHGQLDRDVSADALRALFTKLPHVKLLDQPAEGIYPMPMLATADDAVHIGRIRTVGAHFWAIVTLDNAGLAARLGVQWGLPKH